MHEHHSSVAKMAEVFECLSHDSPWVTEADVAKRLGVHRTTAHRMLLSLCNMGFLEPHYEDARRYTVGRSLYTLGNIYRETRQYLSQANEVVKTVNRLTGEAVTIIELDGRFVVTVLREESSHPFRFTFGVGSIQPAHAPAGGKVLLAELTERELEALYPEETLPRVTTKTVPTRTLLKAQLADIRRRGVAVNIEESCEGLICVASVIRDYSGHAVAALGIAAPAFTANFDRLDLLAGIVSKASDVITTRLGNRGVRDGQVQDIEELCSWWNDRSKTKDDS